MADPLKGKNVLVVDDEPDVCSMIADILTSCNVDVATSFAEAQRKLTEGKFDVAVLDIMGVNGYDLLDEFSVKVPCIMLTARALTAEDLKRSIRGKAKLYLPKHELGKIEDYVRTVVGAKKPLWNWLFERINFSRFFGRGWSRKDAFFLDFEITDEDVMSDLTAGYGSVGER